MRQANARQSFCPARPLAVLMALLCLGAAASASFGADAPQGSATQPATGAEPASLIAQGLDANGAITLTGNQSRLVRTSVPVRAVDLTDPEVVLAKVINPTDIMLSGRKPGRSQLVVWDDQGHSQSIEIIVNADVGGLTEEYRKVLPGAKIEVSSANGTIVLRGRVANAEVADQAAQVAAPYSAANSKVINLLEIGGGQQVMLKVRFAEVSKDAISALGVNFGINSGGNEFGANVIGGVAPFGITQAASGGASFLTVPSPASNVTQFGAFTAGKTPFEIFVSALRQNNLLRVLAEPNLTVMSGSRASFLAGGEFPYPVPQNSGTGTGGTTITIEFKQFGVRLTFMPVVLGDGRIRLHVQPEVSDLDFSQSLTLNGFVIPSITSRTADTTVELTEGQTLSLAGLLNTRVNATNQLTPVLGDLPIIGALFRSVRYERTETELVVLVTPTLVGGMTPEQVPAMPGERWRFPTEGELFLHGDLGGPAADAAHIPTASPPRRFQGTYGFAPITASASNGGR